MITKQQNLLILNALNYIKIFLLSLDKIHQLFSTFGIEDYERNMSLECTFMQKFYNVFQVLCFHFLFSYQLYSVRSIVDPICSIMILMSSTICTG